MREEINMLRKIFIGIVILLLIIIIGWFVFIHYVKQYVEEKNGIIFSYQVCEESMPDTPPEQGLGTGELFYVRSYAKFDSQFFTVFNSDGEVVDNFSWMGISSGVSSRGLTNCKNITAQEFSEIVN